MMMHVYTEPAEINFSKLEERLLQVNDVIARTNFQFSRRLPSLLRQMPTLIMATGGSVASGMLNYGNRRFCCFGYVFKNVFRKQGYIV